MSVESSSSPLSRPAGDNTVGTSPDSVAAPSSQSPAGAPGLPAALEEIVAGFADAPREIVLPMLVEYADVVPPLPAELAEHPELMERVVECQTPFFLHASLADDGTVTIAFEAPREAPTTRAFAGILYEGLAGLTPAQIKAVPDDFYLRMGLGSVISPLRLRGMSAILGRLKHRVALLSAASAHGSA